jgi:two-component system, LytTR family, sensor kinase
MLLMSGDKSEIVSGNPAGADPLRFPSFWRLQIIGGICLYVVVFVASLPDVMKRPGGFRDTFIAVSFMFLGSFVLHPICRSLVRRSTTWLAFGWRMSLWSGVVGTLGASAAEVVALNFEKFDWPDLMGNSMQFAVVLFLWCSLYFSIKQWQQTLRERERLLRAESEAREARLSALRYQLNPHFLFNSLNAASTLMLDGDAAGATRMLSQIGDLLRTTLDSNALPEMPLAQELAFIDQYLAIEQTRLGSRLRVEKKIANDTLDAVVPGMLLQPLVENAVRHGVAALVEGGMIRIESRIHAGHLQIAVSNSGLRRGDAARSDVSSGSNGRPNSNGKGGGMGLRNTGIGLKNTQERLKTLYGNDHQFTLTWPEAGGCEATIEIPLKKSVQSVEGIACAP